jgi:hypothetical protein
MSQWEYRKIALNELSRSGEDIDVLCEAGLDGWELVGVLPNNVAYLKRQVRALDTKVPIGEAAPSAAQHEDGDDNRSGVFERSHETKPKYRDPKTNDTWTGRGRMPNWLKRKQDAGEDLEEYLA